MLSYFHTRLGTDIYYSFPKTQLDAEMSDRLYDIMTQQKEEEYFTHSFGNLKVLNYYFQIHSDWARGYKEMLMVTIMIKQQISPVIEESISILCKEFSKKMQTTEDIFTGFYIKDLSTYDASDKERIKKNETLIKDWVNDLYWETLEDTRKKSEEQKITLLLNDRYIFESLEEISRELKIIDREINISEDLLKKNSHIQNSLSNLNKIIDDLSEGYIEKMTELDIEYEDDLFSTEDDDDIDLQKTKKELIQVLEGEVKKKKEF